ncbi:hypothetical protein RBS60_01220 [Sinomonas sp. ASV486]|uniref:hypothetical protein n=1 Tax=Sinomonas sp. ASV486 TaxID=3051170 RepID=UPI0027DD288F|nr:hypothetical protein [Sinomonas sp. ASV486]MDQ4488812.1 hypothetical protein [Sinomonas sp. ASV486]
MANYELLSVIARLRPEAWDAIIPRSAFRSNRLAAVALNPQPLPPGPPDDLATAAARMTQRLIHLAIEADIRGEDSAGWLTEFVDDYCGSWPHKWPVPWPGSGPEHGAQPDPWRLQEARAASAIILASTASRLGEGRLQAALRDGAEKLADAAVAQR